MSPMTNLRRLAALVALVGVLGVAIRAGTRGTGGEQRPPTAHAVSVAASKYTFDPPRIEVFQDDVIRIDLRTLDIAHSLTIDAYRISKRVRPDQPVTFEFRA